MEKIEIKQRMSVTDRNKQRVHEACSRWRGEYSGYVSQRDVSKVLQPSPVDAAAVKEHWFKKYDG